VAVERLSAGQVRAELLAGGELALVDVRPERAFGAGHILLAVRAGLARFAVDLPRLAPCRSVRLILCDGGDGLAERAAQAAVDLGYADIALLEGGTPAWQAAGYELFTGLNAWGAALAETVDLECHPPSMTAAQLAARRAAGEQVVVLDSRPWEEFLAKHIPGGIDCPGGELVYRVRDLAPDPATTVVVNCAGRSRSLYGAQSLINAGLPNPVFALADGTYGWWRAGFEIATGPGPRAETVSAAARRWALAAATGLASRCGVAEIDAATLALWQGQAGARTLYLLDVRSPQEYAAGHVAGALNAPGGQLVECADDWIGVRGARIVLLDDDGARARMAASWLRQLLYPEVAVLAPGVSLSRDDTGLPHADGAPDEPYYPMPASLEEAMAASAAYLDWQAALVEQVRRDGLLAFRPLRFD